MFFRRKKSTEDKNAKKNIEINKDVKELKAMISGEVIPIDEVPDPVFASKTLGDGIAIRPEENVITSPCDGVISMVADTGHAIGITLGNAAEILIHEGIDTVSLKGEGFHVFVKNGDKVKLGDKLLEFDEDLIKSRGFMTECILIVANSDDYPDMKLISGMNAVQKETTICEF